MMIKPITGRQSLTNSLAGRNTLMRRRHCQEINLTMTQRKELCCLELLREMFAEVF